MFCFCFQSPSLKLQALEAEAHEAPGDSQPPEKPPAQHQPLAAEDKSLQLGHKLLLHPEPQPGRTAGALLPTLFQIIVIYLHKVSSVSALVSLWRWS